MKMDEFHAFIEEKNIVTVLHKVLEIAQITNDSNLEIFSKSELYGYEDNLPEYRMLKTSLYSRKPNGYSDLGTKDNPYIILPLYNPARNLKPNKEYLKVSKLKNYNRLKDEYPNLESYKDKYIKIDTQEIIDSIKEEVIDHIEAISNIESYDITFYEEKDSSTSINVYGSNNNVIGRDINGNDNAHINSNNNISSECDFLTEEDVSNIKNVVLNLEHQLDFARKTEDTMLKETQEAIMKELDAISSNLSDLNTPKSKIQKSFDLIKRLAEGATGSMIASIIMAVIQGFQF